MNITRTNPYQNQPNFKASVLPKSRDTAKRITKELTKSDQERLIHQKPYIALSGASAVTHYYDYVGIDPKKGPLFHVQTDFPNTKGKDNFFHFSTYAQEPVSIYEMLGKATEFVEKGRRALKHGLTQEQAEKLSEKDCEGLPKEWSLAYPQSHRSGKKKQTDHTDFNHWDPI